MSGTMIKEDSYLDPYKGQLKERIQGLQKLKKELASKGKLSNFALGYDYFGLHREKDGWIFREWLPGAVEVFFLSPNTGWSPTEKGRLKKNENHWEGRFSLADLQEGDHYKLFVRWNGGEGERMPAYCTQTYQNPETHIFTALVPEMQSYNWKHEWIKPAETLHIYEVHIGMSLEEGKVGTYLEFKNHILPRILKAGYNAIQFMALMEHPYYGSFGYQVSNFFALTSRFGTPKDFKALVDACHSSGVAVIMDLVHSHAVKNRTEGLSHQDGTEYAYFHSGPRGYHSAWDSRCFNYGKKEVLHFLLSNCAWWLKEYRLDGFRFDGVTSMLYLNHGLGESFDSYAKYFDDNVDNDALNYLSLANILIHEINSNAITIAEDMSGMPGVARDTAIGGLGFNYRLTMGVPDFWIKLLKQKDDEWNVENIWHALTNRRFTEKQITYAESHDQALVGDKTIAFRLMDAAMYDHMSRDSHSDIIDRGMALHKIIRLITYTLGGDGYLNFMGNEFGHPEWIDFPREGNNWSHHYARRQWSLAENQDLRYSQLGEFDREMLINCSPMLSHKYIDKKFSHVSDQVIAYERGPYLIIINLNGQKSFTDYRIPVEKESCRLILDTDFVRFGGWSRNNENMIKRREPGKTGILFYIPARTAQVFAYES
jgi:1,4-alpha-glucan branching enzyme